MRIIAGKAKNKRIQTRKGYDTRPTLERIKEAVFSILGSDIEGKKFLDLYSGTGNIAFEALSRGAKRAIMIEKDQEALKIIIQNVNHLGFENECRAYKNDALRAIEILEKKGEKFDIIFMDPPYKENLTENTIKKISECDLLNDNGIIISEHSNYEVLQDEIGKYVKYDERDYNKKIISFYSKKEDMR